MHGWWKNEDKLRDILKNFLVPGSQFMTEIGGHGVYRGEVVSWTMSKRTITFTLAWCCQRGFVFTRGYEPGDRKEIWWKIDRKHLGLVEMSLIYRFYYEQRARPNGPLPRKKRIKLRGNGDEMGWLYCPGDPTNLVQNDQGGFTRDQI